MSKTEEKKCRCGNSCNNESTPESALLDAIKRILPRSTPPHIAMLIDSYMREFVEDLQAEVVDCDNCEACAEKEGCPVLIFRTIIEHRKEGADKSPPSAAEKEEDENTHDSFRTVCSLCRADGSLDSPYKAGVCGCCEEILIKKGYPRRLASPKKESVGELGGVLKEAHELIHGDRHEAYGSAKDSFGLIAQLWQEYLRTRQEKKFEGWPRIPVSVEPYDVAMLMVLLKVVRNANKRSVDNLVDICGYAALAENL